MHGLLSTDMDSMSGFNSSTGYSSNPGAEVQERVLTTPEGPAPLTTVRKYFPDNNLQGIYIPEINLTAENKRLVHPWLSVHIHEDDHWRFKDFYTSGSSIVDEFTNRRVADTHYNSLAKKYGLPLVDTAGDLEKQLRNYLKKNSSPDDVENIMREVRGVSDFDYQRVMQMPIDIEKDYKNDILHRNLLTGEFITPKKSDSEFKYLV
jgi:hypothetical protein